MMSQISLTKSYIDTTNPKLIFRHEVFHTLFAEAKKEKHEVELVNMDTGERTTNLCVLEKAEEYTKGLITLNLTPNVDNIVVIGCATFDALALFAAAAEVGVGFTHLFVHPPREQRIVSPLTVLSPKVVIFGEGAGGHNASALLSLFDCDTSSASSSRLPFVEHLLYDNTYKDRSPSHKCIKTLNKLREMGESVTEERLMEVRNNVKPDFICRHLFTSGSTGSPKCSSHTQESVVKLTTLPAALGVQDLSICSITMNINVDSLGSYSYLLPALCGSSSKIVMLPETYEESPLKNQGKLLTEAIISERVTQINVTSSTRTAILDYLRDNNITLPHPMKRVSYGGQHISRQMIEEGERLLQGIHHIGYGMTENAGIGITPFGDSEEQRQYRLQARLYPLPNSELRIADEENQVVDIGEVGEIHVKSCLAFKEYRNDEIQTNKAFSDDKFLKTGDAGVMFSDGTFKVLGRMNDEQRFKIYGKVEYPGPIEDIVSQHPDVSQACVVSGKVNDWIGDEITCCIVSRTKDISKRISEEELFDFWRSKGMYERQQPARILYFDRFPNTNNGRKISRSKMTQHTTALIAGDEGLGKCQWFVEKEKAGKTY